MSRHLIPLSQLSSRTRKNLDLLSQHGYTWEFNADKVNRGETSGYYIEGTDPEGNKVTFCRHETGTPGAGQTFLKTPYGNIRLTLLLEKLEDTGKYTVFWEPWVPENLPFSALLDKKGPYVSGLKRLSELPARTAKKAVEHYYPEYIERQEKAKKKFVERIETKHPELREINRIRQGLPEEG